MKKTNYIYFFPILLILSIGLGYYFKEDSLGGAQHDYLFHKKFFFLFLNDFKQTFSSYGSEELSARNSPVFYIIFAFLLKIGFTIENLRYASPLILIGYFYIFQKCLNLKYKNINVSYQILFASVILVSPTIRSLIIWPYPLIWALLIFSFSIFFFLKFQNNKKEKSAFKYSVYNVIFVAFSSYITPNFAVFSLYFLFCYFQYYGFSKKIYFIILLNITLALPAVYYYFLKDFYIFSHDIYKVDSFTKYNIFNKIIITSSLVVFYFLPFIKLNKLSLNSVATYLLSPKLRLLLPISLIFYFFFNFPSGAGGGIFYHLSNKILGNSHILYLVFILSLIIFDLHGFFTKKNIVLFFCLIIFNPQLSIYHKYFDPLIYFLILFLFEIKSVNSIKLSKKLYFKILIFYSFFLILNIYKGLIAY
ncbi:hypothetical protein OAQ73_04660 [Candidatus Pelagibacter sp.]|nr:hypothetical protein [Candidatus Pelagibacter sp.]